MPSILVILVNHNMVDDRKDNLIRLSEQMDKWRTAGFTVDAASISNFDEHYDDIDFKYRVTDGSRQLSKVCNFISKCETKYDWYVKTRPAIFILENNIDITRMHPDAINARVIIYTGPLSIKYGASYPGVGLWSGCRAKTQEKICMDDQFYIFGRAVVEAGAFEPLAAIDHDEPLRECEPTHTNLWVKRNIPLNPVSLNLLFVKSESIIRQSGSVNTPGPRIIVISPQSGSRDLRILTLCSYALAAKQLGSSFYHIWKPDVGGVIVNSEQTLGYSDIFEENGEFQPVDDNLKIDACYSEWQINTFWYPSQSSAQRHFNYTPDAYNWTESPVDFINHYPGLNVLFETSIPIRLPHFIGGIVSDAEHNAAIEEIRSKLRERVVYKGVRSMKISIYILRYAEVVELSRVLESVKELVIPEGWEISEVAIMNNRGILNDVDFPGVRVINNSARVDFSTGHTSRSWNECIIHAFESLDKPKCDILLLAQADAELYSEALVNIVALFNRGILYAAYGAGDEIQMVTPAGVKEVGLFDENFCGIGYHEYDYFLRNIFAIPEKCVITDEVHRRIYKPSLELAPVNKDVVKTDMKAKSEGKSEGISSHYLSIPYHPISKKYFFDKWGFWPHDFDWETNIKRNAVPLLKQRILYPYFEAPADPNVDIMACF